MELPHAHRAIIKRANELGYFPTPAQAKEISFTSAEECGRRLLPKGERKNNRADDRLFNECMDWAIERICSGAKTSKFAGVVSDELIAEITAALVKLKGRQARILIDKL